ncbi:MAG: CoA transferase [Novosphingobium sp.]|nr:CoA transferase [Novosphingobium sp.]
MTDSPAAPFSGLRVIDLSQIYNGPYATYLMALEGAEVIKVEPPAGEPLRKRTVVGGAGLPFAMLNGAKRSIALDLKSEDGKQALLELVDHADVLVENFSPGVMDRLGLGAEVLQARNPRLIYAASSGYGRDGPYKNYPAMDLTMQAMSGALFVTGFPDREPVKCGPAIADFFAGIHLYGAIATALFERQRTGIARRVEVTMQDSIYASLSSNFGLAWSKSDGPEISRTANRHGGLAECPYNVYPTADGHIAIICARDEHWHRLAELMGRPELAHDERYHTLKERVPRMDEVDALVSEWTGSLPTTEVFDTLMSARIACAPVRSLDAVMSDENMFARGSLMNVDHPRFGKVVVQQTPFRLEGAPLRIPEPSEDLGQSTHDVLSQFTTLSDEQINAAAGGNG